jgi:hypothetical protein
VAPACSIGTTGAAAAASVIKLTRRAMRKRMRGS